VLRAGLSVSGFVFFALAVDTEKTLQGLKLVATGITLPLLAYLSVGGGPVFSMRGILLIAPWVISSLQSD